MIPRIFVIGALGRCGRGAVEMAHKLGVPKYASYFKYFFSGFEDVLGYKFSVGPFLGRKISARHFRGQ